MTDDTRALVERIQAWRKDDKQGMASAIELICDAEILLLAALSRPAPATGICDHCGEPLVPAEATWFHRTCMDAHHADVIRDARPAPAEDAIADDYVPPCGLCGGAYPFDTSLPSPQWNRVVRARDLPDYLCLACIVKIFAAAGEDFTATLWDAQRHLRGRSVTVSFGEPPAALTAHREQGQ